MKKIEKILALESATDKKHKLNTSIREVPQKWLDNIENGCSLEQLDAFTKEGFNIFKYQTQITIHGLFPKVSTNRIGAYVNLTQNQNKSIGVRWTAVDRAKKAKLFDYLTTADCWRIENNSTDYYVWRCCRLSDDENEREKQIQKYKDIANRIDTSLFMGNVQLWYANDWGRIYAVLELRIRAFYEKNFAKIVESVTGKTANSIELIIKNREEKARAEREARNAQWEAERIARENRRKANMEAILQNVPSGFERVEYYVPAVGDIFAFVHDDCDGTCAWEYRVVSKVFGKFVESPCDENGNKKPYEKGCEAYNRKIAYLKRK